MKNTLTTCPGAPENEDVILKCMTTTFRDTPYPEATIYRRYTAQRLGMSYLHVPNYNYFKQALEKYIAFGKILGN